MGKHNVLGRTRQMLCELQNLIKWAEEDGEDGGAIEELETAAEHFEHAIISLEVEE